LLNRAGEAAARAGIHFAYHNHDFEFIALDGRLPYDVLLQATAPRHVTFELDLYWITRGGQDPLAYFARWPGRFRLVHVKDSDGPPDHRMADVGSGTIDWGRIFAHGKQAGIEHFFVERDDAPEPLASIAASYAYLHKLRF
jgi:sugar phosphate isomerase/epimerase